MDYETMMLNAENAIDCFHELLLDKKYKEAQDYIMSYPTKSSIVKYFGFGTYQMLLDEMEDALIIPF